MKDYILSNIPHFYDLILVVMVTLFTWLTTQIFLWGMRALLHTYLADEICPYCNQICTKFDRENSANTKHLAGAKPCASRQSM